jgi:hypothetical protein
MTSSVFSKRPKSSVPDHPISHTYGISTSKFFGDQEFFAFCKSSSHHSNGWAPMRVLPKYSFKKLLLGTGTGLWQYAKMSTSLKSTDGLKDAECKKGQLSHRPPIPYVPVIDIVMPKEEPQVFKIKLPDVSNLSMPIYSRGNNKENIRHIVAVLQVIEQKGLPKKCQVLTKAVVRWSKALKNLQEAAEL